MVYANRDVFDGDLVSFLAGLFVNGIRSGAWSTDEVFSFMHKGSMEPLRDLYFEPSTSLNDLQQMKKALPRGFNSDFRVVPPHCQWRVQAVRGLGNLGEN